MAKGEQIIVSAQPQGKWLEGILSGDTYPGTLLEVSGFSLTSGRMTFRAYQPGTDGERRAIIVLLPDYLSGYLSTSLISSGQRVKAYCPLMGEELNMLIANVSGTGDSHAAGETLIAKSGTGTLIATTGTPESEPFRLMESLAALTADTLGWCMYTGY